MFEIVKVKIIQCAFKIKKKNSWRFEASAALSSAMIELKAKGNKILTKNEIDPSTVFSTFDMDKLRKSVDTTGKSALILVKVPSLKVIRISEWRDSSTKCRGFTNVCLSAGGGQVCAPPPSPPYKRLGAAISSLSFSKSLSNLATLLILRRSFQWCRRIILNLSMSKVKNRRKVY